MKRLAIFAAILVTLAVVTAAAAPLIVSSDLVKRQITRQIASWTGRDVTFRGEPQLSFFPYLSMTLQGVTLANAPGMGDQPFVTMESLDGRIRLLPLLIGRVEVAEFRLQRPRIHLAVNAAGRANWLMKNGAIGVQAAETDPNLVPGKDAPPPAEPQISITLGHFVVANGTIVYTNAETGRREEAHAVDLDFRWPATSEAAVASGSLEWRGEPLRFDGTIDSPLDLMAGGASAIRFAVASKPLRIDFTGNALRLRDLQIEGDINVTAPSVRDAIAWMGTPIGSGPILGAGSVSGKINWVGPTMSFAEATVELDGNTGDGAFSVNFAGERPDFQGTLDFDKLDLSPYLEAVEAPIRAVGSWPIAPIHLPLVSSCDLDLRISAGQILLGSARIDKAAGSATIKDGRVAVSLGEGQFYGGHVEAGITAEMRDDAFVGQATVKIDKASTKQALAEAAGISALDGTASAEATASVHGRSWGEFAETLAGTVKIAISDGSLAGISVSDLAKRLGEADTDMVIATEGSTAFKTLGGTLDIAEGTVKSQDLHAEGDNFAVDLSGSASLYSALIDGLGTLTITEAENGGTTKTTAIPFAIGGSLREPVFLAHGERTVRRSSLDLPSLRRGAQPG